MDKNSDNKSARNGTLSREDRLKAALKSNMQRRKAQARARSGPSKTTQSSEKEKE